MCYRDVCRCSAKTYPGTNIKFDYILVISKLKIALKVPINSTLDDILDVDVLKGETNKPQFFKLTIL